jgi:hypothetical protein
LFITDRHDDRARLHADAPVSRCADVIDPVTVKTLAQTLAARLAHDEHRAGRDATRRFYFDNLGRGESTERFLTAVDDVMSARDRLMGQNGGGTDATITTLITDEPRDQVA